MILLKKAYCEKVIQIKAACHGNTRDSLICGFFPQKKKKKHMGMRIDFILQKLRNPLGRDFLLAALIVYTF